MPLIFAFCFLPNVPRAFRVASALAALATFCSGVSGVRLDGVNPKSARRGALRAVDFNHVLTQGADDLGHFRVQRLVRRRRVDPLGSRVDDGVGGIDAV